MLLLSLLPTAGALLPLPTYPECGEVDREDLCPADLDSRWWLISYIPSGSRATIRAAEADMGSGCAADRAWRYSTGRFDATVAVADSGVDWANGAYRNNLALNTAELPLPQYADGADALSYDLDGNGLVNIQDYAEDPRVDITAGHDRADHHLDGSDLLAAFSDGVDDDGNGYVDDIAGWDFFGNDNDAYHSFEQDFGTHGDGVIEDIVSEGADEHGDIGVCPGCSFTPLRIGDTFVSDGGRVAEAVLYAADRGAVSVSMATGSLSAPAQLYEAVQYARERGVTLVGAAGDENAYHHNMPSLIDGILYVHSVRSNGSDENNGVYSYFNTWNCNNWGPRVQLVADSSACATGAVAVTAGAAALIQSAAMDQGARLSSDEVYQLLIQSADDVDLSEEERSLSRAYPSGPGWDPFYGYGRVNVGRAVERIQSGDIPPEVDITSPSWFQVFDNAAGKLEIRGRIAADHSSGYTWKLEVGAGHDPRDWSEVASGSGTEAFDGALGTVDLTGFPSAAIPEPALTETILERADRVFAPAVTVRVVVTDDDGRRGEFQKTFFVHDDPDRLTAFPLQMGASGESSPNLGDLDGDGPLEIVVADASGFVHAYKPDGSELSGWPVRADLSSRFHADQPAAAAVSPAYDRFLGATAIADLDGDGAVEVVAASIEGKVYVWHSDGSPMAGFPVGIIGREPSEFTSANDWDNGFLSGAALADLDGDGKLEIIAGAMDQRLYVWDHTGADWGPYPIDVCAPENCETNGARIINTPAIGDVDGDGAIDIAIGTNETVQDGKASISFIFDAVSATALPGWPVVEYGLVNEAGLLPIVGEGHPASMALANIDGGAALEVSSPVMLGTSPLYNADGTVHLDVSYVSSDYSGDANTTEPSLVQMNTQPAFGDLNLDGTPDYVVGGTGTLYLITLALYTMSDFQHGVSAWDGKTGAALPGWPRQIEDLQFLISPAIADVSGDGKPEVMLGSAGYLVHAWDGEGNEAPGWPKFTGNWLLGSPAVGDIDGDGYLEVVVTTREGWLWAWRTDGRADQDIQWASMHHDAANTRNYETPIPRQAGPPDVDDDKKCGCGDDKGGEAAAGLLLLPLLWLGRRRR